MVSGTPPFGYRDITCPCPEGITRTGELGYFSTGEVAEGWQDLLGDNQVLYRGLREEIDRGEVYLRVFVVPDADAIRYRHWPTWTEPLPRPVNRIERVLPPALRWSRPKWSLSGGYFPQPCTITDVAITNIRGCWLCTHPALHEVSNASTFTMLSMEQSTVDTAHHWHVLVCLGRKRRAS